jgi:hypothetical protein
MGKKSSLLLAFEGKRKVIIMYQLKIGYPLPISYTYYIFTSWVTIQDTKFWAGDRASTYQA